jgi:hypothetical protein
MIYRRRSAADAGSLAGAGRCARLFSGSLALGLVLAFAVADSLAQDQLPPPPVPVDSRSLNELLTDAEKSSLERVKGDSKDLIEEYIKIAQAHLNSVVMLVQGDNARAAVEELNIYNKSMAEAGKVIFAMKNDRRRMSKRLEQTLYKQIKILESIERSFPAERQPYAELALKTAKQLRVQALNEAFAGGDILKDPEEAKPKNDSPVKDGASNKQMLQPASFSSPHNRLGAYLLPYRFQPRFISVHRVSYQIPGDYLTEEEDDQVRVAQEPDKRMKVFMKIADRRIAALTGNIPAADPADKKSAKKIEEEKREWGELPRLSRTELLRHYARAVEESMVKLEDAYERNPKSSALPKALATLRDATDKHLEALRALSSQVKGQEEEAALREAIEQAETANKGARDGLKQS